MSEAAVPAQRAPSSSRTRLWVTAVLLLLALALAITARFALSKRSEQPLPKLGTLPAFALRDQSGAPFGDADMRGRPWVADFVFTKCPSTCPMLTARMKQLQGIVLEEEKKRGKPTLVRFVSFSVDPENDTPAVLDAYAKKNGADPRLWTFVTGEAPAVQQVIMAGFKISTQRIETGAGEYDVIHGNWFVLGDATGTVRGYYEVKEPGQVEALAKDLFRVEQGQ
jgi:protein SCO1/2